MSSTSRATRSSRLAAASPDASVSRLTCSSRYARAPSRSITSTVRPLVSPPLRSGSLGVNAKTPGHEDRALALFRSGDAAGGYDPPERPQNGDGLAQAHQDGAVAVAAGDVLELGLRRGRG